MSATPAQDDAAPRPADRLRQGAVLVAIAAMIAMNVAANALPLAGRSTGEVSAAYPVPFTPAGYVFAIWALIYLGLIAFGVFQALPGRARDPRLRDVAPWVVLGCAANVAWLVAWHTLRIPLSMALMVVLLIALLATYERLHRGPSDRATVLLARLPFGIYLGWITVATVANASVTLWHWGFRGGPWAPETWALIMVFVATAIGVRVLQARGDVAFALVLIWAFVGIAVARGFPGLLPGGALVASALLAGGIAGRLVRGRADAEGRA
ncbi:MAG: hypothetical protein U5K81_03750 [Trueperaceae bacterium]|nr:hypothetical protein [Trueperaceae bacterium]